jgi:hypothetical protein
VYRPASEGTIERFPVREDKVFDRAFFCREPATPLAPRVATDPVNKNEPTKKAAVRIMTSQQSIQAAGALLLAISSATHGQDQASATKHAAASTSGKSFVRFEGTDLHLGSLPPVTFHGFASQGFIASDSFNYLGHSRRGSFQFNEMGLNASISPFERTRIAAQAFAFDLGNVGNHDFGLDYGLIDYTFNNYIGVRGGRIRRPEGIYNHIQDVDLARTSVLLPQGMYDARWRDFSASVDGGSIYGNIGLGKGGSLSYEAYAGFVNLSQQGGVARLLQNSVPAAPIGSFTGVNDCPMTGIQLWWTTPVDGLRAGLSLTKSFAFSYDYRVNPPFGPGAIRSELDVIWEHLSLEYQWKSWTFQAEYKQQAVTTHNSTGGVASPKTTSDSDSWYIGAAYRVNKWLEVGSYYTEHYGDTSNRSGTGSAVRSDANQKDAALSFRFDPTPWWVMKVEGHYISGTSLLRNARLNPVRNGDGWLMLAMKTTFSF